VRELAAELIRSGGKCDETRSVSFEERNLIELDSFKLKTDEESVVVGKYGEEKEEKRTIFYLGAMLYS
jgi:hypothetical protein